MGGVKAKIANYPWKTASGRTIKMGVGCAYLGSNAKERRDDPIGDDVRLLERCYEAGFRYFDTSADYGESEDVLGGFLKRIDRKSIFLATKSPFRFRDEPIAKATAAFKATFYKSFERMDADYIDLYQIHDTDDVYVCLGEVIPFLRERREEGLIGAIGMGTRSLIALEQGIRCGALESALSYLEYSLLKTSARPLIGAAEECGAAFINASTLHFGLLKSADPLGRTYDGRKPPSLPSQIHASEAAASMRELLKELGVDVIAAALQISLLEPRIDMTLNGIARASNLASTLEAMDRAIHPEQWAAILKAREALPYAALQDMP